MQLNKKTAIVAHDLNLRVFTLLNWIRHRVIPTPVKDSSGHYVWSEEMISAAKAVRERRIPSAMLAAKS